MGTTRRRGGPANWNVDRRHAVPWLLGAGTSLITFAWSLPALMMLLVAVIGIKAVTVLVTESLRSSSMPIEPLQPLIAVPPPRPVPAPTRSSIALPV